MPVFDFNNTPEEKKEPVCTYTIFRSNAPEASADQPILVLDNSARQWKHHSCGVFENPNKRTAFEFKEEGGAVSADILRIDARFVSLVRWLGEHRINVRLSGENRPEGYAVYRIRETAFGGGTKLSAEDGFLQFMIERLLASSAPSEELEDEDQVENGDEMKLTSLQSITDFLTCAGRTLPDNIQLWARRNLAVARSAEVSPEERRHAQRALSIMMNVQWKHHYFEAIDPEEARRILDEELYGMEKVKQRIIETIIQINRTHTLPAYGLLLVGPAGNGKISDRLRGGPDPEASLDDPGHELHQRSRAAHRKLPGLRQREAGHHHGGFLHGGRVEPRLHHQRAGQGEFRQGQRQSGRRPFNSS